MLSIYNFLKIKLCYRTYWKQWLAFLTLCFLVFACSGGDGGSDDSNNPCPNQPQLTTLEVSNITYNENTDLASATFSGEIQNIQLGANCETFSITNQGFVYSTNIQPTTSDNVVNANGENASANVSDLMPETTYYVRAYLTNTLGTFYGNQVSFTTPENPDLEAPVITIIGDNPLELNLYEEYEEFGATALDNVDGDISDNIEINSNVNSEVEGSYEVIYSVSDNSGNSASEIRTVNVIANPVYLDENGVTIKAYEWAEVGDIGIINGWEYKIVDNNTILESIPLGYYLCTTRVTNMYYLFYNDVSGQEISSWDTSNVTNMNGMFRLPDSFSSTLPENDVRYSDISNWDVSNVTNMERIFENTPFNQDISNWDVSNVTTMANMFRRCNAFNQDISNWDVSNVTNMERMFEEADYFNQNISSWNVSNVTTMKAMFKGSSWFNQPLDNWDVSNVIYMEHMFDSAGSFNQPLSNWNVNSVIWMHSMFQSTTYNQDLSSWNVENVEICAYFCHNTTNWTLPKPNFNNCGDIGCN